MALLPDFGTWLLRSVRRETGYFSDSPVSVIERLNALPRPLRTADKDTLVGAVLTLGPSLQVALHMLLELLPLDESRERLGEVLVPTLGQLQRSLESTLSSFEGCGVADLDIDIAPDADDTPLPTPQAATYGSVVRSVSTSTSEDFVISKPEPSPLDTPMQIRTEQHSQRKRQPSIQFVPTHDEIPRTLTASPERVATPKEKFPTLDETDTRPPSPVAKPQQRWPDPAADLALVKEFRAEMRVNAAIQVAVDSLEFAEGQLKIVKEVNRLYGGSTSSPPPPFFYFLYHFAYS
ncbi:hypothetical protein B0H67DRAFT_260363 [Lasiosphaeris hirsuta]|uniref:Uncharacterized protein n=1 Tax=Lasiosphaeris hirsuta TaxID=260670 RepID=A0AA40DWK5_9PEZI|nr:hypothetical protein B0H67DRAFT_260363 [Lasiosphaeris hirsuta]